MFKKIFVSLLLSFSLIQAAAAEQTNPVVVMTTSEGVIELEMMPEQAPKTVANFLKYVDNGFFEGTIFHRVIKDFMIQGGGFTMHMDRKETLPPVQNESGNGLQNLTGTIAMARTQDPHSASSQFFINLKDNHFLNGTSMKAGYAVFGRVSSGMDIVTKIGATETGTRGAYRDVPAKPILIQSVKLKQAE
ncbi:peptidylprolyl isomerase [Amphritea balenae]|uniref:Peptidyl-prolyl cis-trans isomerase n=1 Tax=Amphritea balenae TaxID=452629 RepID=A0A3P1SXD4_9GAMM|nr:peptidylprolyl isomerase [Amphritea balenae]RRD01769.1 peptidyl-prolyl cis-trans isomerase [Amphritea balenae]GGK54182.1 peptidyl-prolyl cis-trans isomerase [Amphritea balenae]